MTSIGIVGAGAGAAAATYRLDDLLPEATVTILEKSRGVCGRAATRRRGEVRYDHGANYLKSDDERVTELVTDELDDEGLVDITDPVWTFDGDGQIAEGRDADDHKWSYEEGLTQIAKRLFARTDATIHHETRVEGITRADDQWRLTDADGDAWGPFDALLVNPPAPQTAPLVENADWDSDARDALATAAAAVDYRTIYTAVLHYPFELDVPYYALVNTDGDHDVGWLSREECKGGHVPAGESLLIVQAAPEWSVAHYDDPPTEATATLAAKTAELLDDDRLSEPDWTDHQGWRYALPNDGVAREPLREAEKQDLYCAGDWVAGDARLHAAIRTGLDAGERIAAEH
jgi:renalase